MVKKTSFNRIYDLESFRKGFNLILEQSDEKVCIARYLAQNIEKILSFKDKVLIADLAGGSGIVWVYVSHLLRSKVLPKLEVSLIDSSWDQIKSAKEHSKTILWLKPQVADAVGYLDKIDSRYECVTAIHFLPGLKKGDQLKFINNCKKALKSKGIFISIQPNDKNPLTQIKIDLIQELTGRTYLPSYPFEEINPNEVSTISSTLKLSANQFLSLALFLLGERATGNENEELINHIFLRHASKIGSEYEIPILNDCLLWRKN